MAHTRGDTPTCPNLNTPSDTSTTQTETNGGKIPFLSCLKDSTSSQSHPMEMDGASSMEPSVTYPTHISKVIKQYHNSAFQ